MTETELQIHRVVWRYICALRLVACHVPNGEWRDMKTAKRLKELGVVPGVQDLLIFNPPRSGEPGLGLELKTITGKESAAQREWRLRLEALGWRCEVTHGLDEPLELLKDLYGKVAMPWGIEMDADCPLDISEEDLQALFFDEEDE